jgi:oxygen-dependent protoporphyrinogen oxidase
MPGPGQDLFSMAWNLITEPVFKGVFTGALFEPGRDARPSDLEDESVAAFLSRRLGGPQPGDNIVSAVLHGIYAGDIYQLSAKSIMAKAWEWERWQGSFGQAMVARARDRTDVIQRRDLVLGNDIGPKLQHFLTGPMHYAAVYTFKEGINTLASALEKSLRANSNIQFHINEKVTSVEYDDETDGIKVYSAAYPLQINADTRYR